MRLIHAVRDINAETATARRSSTIALYTDAERTAMFVREADEAYPLGPAAARPYLDHDLLESALLATGADAAWVGWGFVAEDPQLRRAVRAHRHHLHRPERRGDAPARRQDRLEADRRGGRRARSRRGAAGSVDTLDAALAAAPRDRLPADAQGHRRRRRSRHPGDPRRRRADATPTSAPATRPPARSATTSCSSSAWSPAPATSRCRSSPTATAPPGRSACATARCSGATRRSSRSRRRRCSAREQVDELKASAERLALAVGYCGAGTVEFLYHPRREVVRVPRGQHPAAGRAPDHRDHDRHRPRPAADARRRRRTARRGRSPPRSATRSRPGSTPRTPTATSRPSPGRIELLELPSGPGIRVDTGVSEGDTIPADFDSMIAKIIAHGRTREEALARLRRAVAETAVVIEGGATNKSFILDLLDQPEVIDASADTGWIDRVRARGPARGRPAFRRRAGRRRHRGLRGRRAGRAAPACSRPPAAAARRCSTASRARSISSCAGSGYKVAVSQHRSPALPRHRRPTDGDAARRRRRRASGSAQHRTPADRVRPAVPAVDRDARARPLRRGRRRRAPHQPRRGRRAALARAGAGRGDPGAPSAAEVAAGAPVLVLESMKMETRINAPFAATVRELHVSAGSQVETGAPLIRLEPIGDDAEAAAVAATVDLDLPADRAVDETAPEALADLQRGAARLRRRSGRRRRHAGSATSPRATPRPSAARTSCAARSTLLSVFADFAELSRNRPADEEAPHGAAGAQPARVLPQLPAEPRHRAQRAAGAVPHQAARACWRTTASPTSSARPSSRSAVFRIFLAQQRSAPDLAIVTAILQRWHTEPRTGRRPRDLQVREVLERLVLATQLRFPAVGDLARSVRFRWFDQPVVDSERADVLAGVRDEVAYLASNPDSPGSGRADGRPGRDPGAHRQLPGRAARGRRPDARADARGADPPALPRVRAARPALAAGRRPAGRRWPTTCSTTGRRHLVSTVGTFDELAAGQRPGRARSPSRLAARAGRPAGRGRPLPRLAGRARRRRTNAAAQLLERLSHAAVRAATCAGWPSASAAGRRPSGRYFTFRPTQRRRAGRGRPGARAAPDGRPAPRPVAAARLRHHPARRARGRAALPLRRHGQRGRPAAGRAGPGPRARGGARRRRPGQFAAAGRAGDRQLRRGRSGGRGRCGHARRPRWT